MARAASFISTTGNAYIDGVLAVFQWDVSVSNEVTFSFPSAASNYVAGGGYTAGAEPSFFITCTAAEKTAFRAALAIFSEYCNLVFTEITETDSVHAAIRISRTTDPDGPAVAWSYYPDFFGSEQGGDIWLGPGTNGSLMQPGRYHWHTVIHEIGHALGLKHAHLTELGHAAVPADKDGMEYTMMTYRSYVNGPASYSNETFSYAQTPMVLDILALQHMYGRKSVRTGDTVWAIDPNTGVISVDGVAWLTPGANRVFATLPWDSGGINTLDLSTYTSDLDLDLRAEGESLLSATQLPLLGSPAGVNKYPRGSLFVPPAADANQLPDRVKLGNGNDVVVGSPTINNTVVFSGARANYTCVENTGDGTFTFTDNRGGTPTGVNIVSDVEFIEFSDVTIGTPAAVRRLRSTWS